MTSKKAPPKPAAGAPELPDDAMALFQPPHCDQLYASEIVSVQIFQIIPKPEGGRPDRHRVIKMEPNCETTLDDIQAVTGGGLFGFYAYGARGTFVGGFEYEFPGPSKLPPRKTTATHNAPIIETATGMLGVSGASPQESILFALMQQQMAQVRADAQLQVKTNSDMIAALLGRKGDDGSSTEALNHYKREVVRLQDQLDTLRDTNGKLREENLELKLANLNLQHRSSGKIGDALTDIAKEQAPELMDVLKRVVGLLEMKGGDKPRMVEGTGAAVREVLPNPPTDTGAP